MTSANAHVLRQARAARTRMLRRRAIAGAVALFIAVWLVVAAVLVSGHDPALVAKASLATQSSSGNSSSASGGSGSSSSSSDDGSSSDDSGAISGGGSGTSSNSGATASASPSSVTTRSS